MAIKTKNQPNTFNEGRGGGRGLPLTDADNKMREDYEIIDPFPMQSGDKANDMGAKPIFVVGNEGGFHTGRGSGRGHGPDSND